MDKQTKAALIKAVCAVTTDSQTLAIAKWWEMTPNGRAAAHLDQYLEGKGDLKVDLAKLMQDDQTVQFKVHSEIIFSLREGKSKGTVAIPQSAYSNKDWQFAIGSMNVNWTFPSTNGTDKVHVGFRNEYRWHPNEARISQCVHQAADNLRTRRARNYWQEGSAEVVLWLPRLGVPSRFHIAKTGDTLSRIAQQYYGNASRWQEIHASNKQRIPDPNRLAVGTIVEVPSVR